MLGRCAITTGVQPRIKFGLYKTMTSSFRKIMTSLNLSYIGLIRGAKQSGQVIQCTNNDNGRS